MTYDKIIDDEVQHPVQNHVASAACSVIKHLLRHPFFERMIEKINYFRNKFAHVKKKLYFCSRKS